MSVDSVRRIPVTHLPKMTEGAGRYDLYLLTDVIGYVTTRRNTGELVSAAVAEVLDRSVDSAQGRSQRRRT